MLLLFSALVLLLSGFVARRLQLSVGTKRRLVVIAGVTLLAVVALSWLRLSPIAALAALVGLSLAGQQVMQEIGRRGHFEELDDQPRPPPRPVTGMDRGEALAVLGLEGAPDDEAITAAHKRMIVRAHPDQGGSDYLAAKVNEAKQVLLNMD